MIAALLVDGPFAGDRADAVPDPPPEHLRISWCRRCRDTHWYIENEGEWPWGATRYSLVGIEEGVANYVHNGIGGGDERHEHDHVELREPEPATSV